MADRRVPTGAGTRLSWRLSAAGFATDVKLLRLRSGRARSLGTRRVGGEPGRNSLRIGPRWRGKRLRPGRYRVELRGVGREPVAVDVRRVRLRITR